MSGCGGQSGEIEMTNSTNIEVLVQCSSASADGGAGAGGDADGSAGAGGSNAGGSAVLVTVQCCC